MRNLVLVLLLFFSLSAKAATGEIELIGTIVASTGTASANINDGSLSTVWTDNPNGWIGYDLGAGTNATVTGWLFAPQPSTQSSYGKEDYMQGVLFQSDTTGTFSSPTTVDTVPTFPFYFKNKMWERPVNSTARAFRLYYPSWSGLAELRLYATVNTLARARPIPPVISPWGGRFPSGSATVTMTSRTTSASIYYTTNGTVPSVSSILYTGPFQFNFSGTAQIQAIAYEGSLSTKTSSVSSNAFFNSWSFKAGEDIRDDTGTLVEAHAGDIYDNTAVDGFYYWYGMGLNYDDTGLVDLPTGGYKGIWMYKGTDLMNWKFVGHILPDLGITVQRAHFIKNATSGLLVMWGHNTRDSLSCVATSTLPTGPWNWVSTNVFPAGGVKDCNIFKDLDGTAYLIHADTNQVGATGKLRVTLLASDYLTPTASQSSVRINSSDEAPVVVRNGTNDYYCLFSAGNYYDNTLTYSERYIRCSSMLGSWTSGSVNNLWAVDPVNDNRFSPVNKLNGQPSFAVKYNGQWLLGRDQWHNNITEPGTGLYTSRQVWVPFSFNRSGAIVTDSPVSDPWDFSTAVNTFNTTRSISGRAVLSGGVR